MYGGPAAPLGFMDGLDGPGGMQDLEDLEELQALADDMGPWVDEDDMGMGMGLFGAGGGIQSEDDEDEEDEDDTVGAGAHQGAGQGQGAHAPWPPQWGFRTLPFYLTRTQIWHVHFSLLGPTRVRARLTYNSLTLTASSHHSRSRRPGRPCRSSGRSRLCRYGAKRPRRRADRV